jgi:hypothetical protein
MVADIKVERGCKDCGFRAHPDALQFDHLPGQQKIAAVSSLIAQCDETLIRAEIEKCEVVCANCHAIRTAERRRARRERAVKV